MHRRSVRIPLPAFDAGLVSNLVMVVSLAAVCVMVALLTDWRWGGLLAGLVGFAGAVYYQHIAVVEEAPVVEVPARPRVVKSAA